MSVDARAPRSRRGVLRAAAGAAAGAVGASLALPGTSEAADVPLLLNTDNYASAMTSLSLNVGATDPVAVSVHAEVDGIWVQSVTSTPLHAHARALASGIIGVSSGGGTGILGASKNATNESTPGARGQVGVYGYANNSDAANGVYGESLVGTGVVGYSVENCGVYGHSPQGIGVKGEGPSIGVFGTSDDGFGVSGDSTSSLGVRGMSMESHGVSGATEASDAAGVSGSAGPGIGVWGETTSGIGVRATGNDGIALKVEGRAVLSRSGRATADPGVTRVDVTVAGGLPAGSLAFATVQGYQSGLAVAGVQLNTPSAGKLRIRLTKETGASIKVAWMVIG